MQTGYRLSVAGRLGLRTLVLMAFLLASGTLCRAMAAQETDAQGTIVSLCSISFEPSAKPSTRISNQGRACLDDVALNLQKRPETKLALIGNARILEKASPTVAAHRAAVVKKYLVREKGIEVTRVVLYTGHQDAATVSIDLLPPGRGMDATLVVAVNEAKLH